MSELLYTFGPLYARYLVHCAYLWALDCGGALKFESRGFLQLTTQTPDAHTPFLGSPVRIKGLRSRRKSELNAHLPTSSHMLALTALELCWTDWDQRAVQTMN